MRAMPALALDAASSRSLRFFSRPSTLSLRSSSSFFCAMAARFCSLSAFLRSASSFSCTYDAIAVSPRARAGESKP